MADSLRTIDFYQNLEAEHRTWLLGFDQQYLCNWEKLLEDNEEAAFAEAVFRRYLQGCAVTVEPNEDLNRGAGGPDFRCRKEGYKFYVEVTCIQIDTATRQTGIVEGPQAEPTGFRSLNKAIFAKCQEKAPQLEKLDAPCLLAIGTFHTFAGMISFQQPFLDDVLMGEWMLGHQIDMRTGNRVTEDCPITHLRHAAFLCWNAANEVECARKPISGLLLCPLKLEELQVWGVLNPEAIRPFDPAILPQVEFHQITPGQNYDLLQVEQAKVNKV